MAGFTSSFFKQLESGDEVRITLADGTTTLDAIFRRFINDDDSVVVVTTPVPSLGKENDEVHYIRDYQEILHPIPPPEPANINVAVGDSVEVVFNFVPLTSLTGTVVGTDPRTGIIQINDGVNDLVCKDYKYFKVL